MFIYTFKASSIKFFAVLLLAVVALVALITLVPDYDSIGEVAAVNIDYSNIKSESDCVSFLTRFGYSVDTPAQVEEVTIPDDFDAVYSKYNDVQRAQGLNLKKYRGKTVTKYAFFVNNYEGYEGRVVATVLVFKNKIIAGDICGIDGEGFAHGFEK